MSILLLGASGYIGRAIFAAMQKRGIPGIAVSRQYLDYTKRQGLIEVLEREKPGWVINAAAFIPRPSVDLCEKFQAETLMGNLKLPAMLAMECAKRGIAMGHISTGCLYGDDHEYVESEEPTRKLEDYAGLYVEIKYASELLVRELCPESYVWRIRIPFDNLNHPRNYLTKLQSYTQIWNHVNSLTHRGDFANAALNMIERDAPCGVYNMTNRGSISAQEILDKMWELKIPVKMETLVPGPVTGSRLSTAKLEATGCGMRDVVSAIDESLKNWVP